MTAAAHHVIANDGDQQDPMQHAHQPQVQPHIAIEYVAELVRDHTLQLVAAEVLDRAAIDSDHRVARRETSRKSVDARFLVEQIDGWHARPGGQRHLFDHVQQALLERVARVALQMPAAKLLGDRCAPAVQLHRLVQTADGDDGDRAADHEQEDFGLPPVKAARCVALLQAGERHRSHHGHVQRQNHQRHGDDEIENQKPRFAASRVLTPKKVHQRGIPRFINTAVRT